MCEIGNVSLRLAVARAVAAFKSKSYLRDLNPEEVHVNPVDEPADKVIEGLAVVVSGSVNPGRIRVTTRDLPDDDPASEFDGYQRDFASRVDFASA